MHFSATVLSTVSAAWARFWRHLLGLSMLAGLFGLSAMLSSCSTVSRSVMAPPPVIEGATFVGNKACVECHGVITKKFPDNVHARMHLDHNGPPGGTSCESCHGAGSRHVQAGGGRGRFVHNPGRNPEACFSCHEDIHADFKLPQHHPLPEGHMNCIQCHDPHGSDVKKAGRGLAMGRQNETCAGCHRQQSKPVIFEHEAMREGCTVCHQPHGSINSKMLNDRDNNLCLKCHAQTPSAAGQIYIGSVPHTTLLQRGTCWTSGCHTAVHGSNVDSTMRY